MHLYAVHIFRMYWLVVVFLVQISNIASIWFISLFLSIFATGILEMRWSGVGIDEWWRNEQFWVIGGVSSHLFAVFQGLLKVLAGIDTNFTVTSKASDEEGDFTELYTFKWTTLLIPPTTLLIINLVGVVAGISYAINSGYQSWGPLFGKLFFAFWVIIHLYPFLKGLMGRQNRTPTIVVVWSILLASIFSLLWVRIDPFTTRVTGPDVEECGINCWWDAASPTGVLVTLHHTILKLASSVVTSTYLSSMLLLSVIYVYRRLWRMSSSVNRGEMCRWM